MTIITQELSASEKQMLRAKVAKLINILGYETMAKDLKANKATAVETLNFINNMRCNVNQPRKWKYIVNTALVHAIKCNL